ncbi:MAG: DNA adenine methylase, partial [Cyanobacteria bacterium P01_G01_bin.49]
WKYAQSDLKELVRALRKIKLTCTDGRKLFKELTEIQVEESSDFERAVRFFVLNRITFSGTVESGGFSQAAFEKRFTNSSIDRLESLANILPGIKITNLDYRDVIKSQGQDTFIFLDPPYLKATKSKLYGKDGNLHTVFNHSDFAEAMAQCQHQWLITYDDSEEIRNYFEQFTIVRWELQYGMNNYKQGKANKGKEIFIRNYEIEQDVTVQPPNFQQLSLDFNSH